MIKKIAAIAFFIFSAITIISCSKGNPKNTDLIGDKSKQLIVGKWRKVADTTVITEYGNVISKTELGLSDDYFQYNADGSLDQYSGTTLVGSITYSVVKDVLYLNTPAVSGGGVSIPALTIPVLIRKLDATDMRLLNHTETDTTGTGSKKITITNQVIYYKRQ